LPSGEKEGATSEKFVATTGNGFCSPDLSGNRGYRAIQLEAGAIGGRIYLTAYAQHLGATGLTFFDDEVINFFSPHARDKSAIFLLAIGKPLKRKPQ
jgi:nitroreductase